MEFEPYLPIYENIKRHIRRQIESGELQPGDRVPSEHQLSQYLGVSRSQTRQALRDLDMEGLIVRSPGRGSFVAPRVVQGDVPRSVLRSILVAHPAASDTYYPFSGGYTYYTNALMDGLIKTAQRHGFHTMFYYLNFDEASELEFLRHVHTTGAEGLALYSLYRSSRECELVAALCRSDFPCVLFDRYLPGLSADFVGTDNVEAAARLTAGLLHRGHTAIAYVARDFLDSVMDDRLEGYRRTLEEAGIGFDPALVGDGGDPSSVDGLREAVTALLRAEAKPSAFMVSDDRSASIVFEELERHSLRVPEDAEIACVDDREPAAYCEAPWLAAVQDGYEVGRQTAELLASRIQFPHQGAERRLVPITCTFEEGAFHSPLAESTEVVS